MNKWNLKYIKIKLIKQQFCDVSPFEISHKGMEKAVTKEGQFCWQTAYKRNNSLESSALIATCQ